ncbi:MAG: hypothetical protein ACKPJJ_25285, partial [Planctomycetaceae bacterium]
MDGSLGSAGAFSAADSALAGGSDAGAFAASVPGGALRSNSVLPPRLAIRSRSVSERPDSAAGLRGVMRGSAAGSFTLPGAGSCDSRNGSAAPCGEVRRSLSRAAGASAALLLEATG